MALKATHYQPLGWGWGAGAARGVYCVQVSNVECVAIYD